MPEVAAAICSPLDGLLQVTSECRRSLLEPLLWELREEKCGHLWQPALAAASRCESFAVFEREVRTGRPTTVFTYFMGDEAIAVATISARISKDSPEDGIPVLGRGYVRPKYRGQSVYGLVLRHRLELCRARWGSRLLGVHLGTSSPRVELVFRALFPNRVIELGVEDLGAAGLVSALLGLTVELERQTLLPVPGCASAEHRLVREYLTHGAAVTPVAEVRPALRALVEYQDAYRLLDQFLQALTNLR